MNSKSQDQCLRCGTCCRKGGPALHHIDADLYLQGRLKKTELLTLRKGELVFDNVQDRVVSLEQEIIRVRSMLKSRACVFFDSENNACSIYDYRPWECRALKCWDPSELEMSYEKKRLNRFDLIAVSCALGEIVKDHEMKCSYARIRELVTVIRNDQDRQAMQELGSILDYDLSLREQMRQKAGAESEELEFLFGPEQLLNQETARGEVKENGSRFVFKEKAV